MLMKYYYLKSSKVESANYTNLKMLEANLANTLTTKVLPQKYASIVCILYYIFTYIIFIRKT